MSRITDSARGKECLLHLPGVCRGGTETTVWAHSNRYLDGKGRGIKAHDHNGAYACYWCHAVYDRQMQRPAGLPLETVESEFTRAMGESQQLLIEQGLWDGETIPERKKKQRKSRKIPVTSLTPLQRMALGVAK